MLSKGQIEFYRFAGAAAMNGTLDNAAAVDQSSNYDPGIGGVVRIPIASHGLIAGTDTHPTFVFIQGSTSFNGIRRIVTVPNANNIDVAAKYVAETFAGTELYSVGVGFDENWAFAGYEIHVDAAPTTVANLTIARDFKDVSLATYWDTVYLTQPMATIVDVVEQWETAIPLSPDTIVKTAWANAEADDWGVELKVVRLN